MPEKFSIDQDAVRLLASLLTESGLTEIEFQQGESRIRVAKEAHVVTHPASPLALATPSSGAIGGAGHASGAPEGAASSDKAVSSPMVGIVYLASEPGAPPYVRVGDTIQEGQTLFIIEAMKIMNPIKAKNAGTVAKICVVDASPVEYGDILLLLS